MAGKLRKMLGRADDQAIIDLMHLIETQRHATLNQWGRQDGWKICPGPFFMRMK